MNTNDKIEQYNELMDEEHYMLRFSPKNTPTNGNVVETKGPELTQANVNEQVVSSPTPQQEAITTEANLNTNVESVQVDQSNEMEKLLSLAVEKKASDLHISKDVPPYLRIDGQLFPLGTNNLSEETVNKLFSSILDENLQKELQTHLNVDFTYELKTGQRFRVNIFFSRGSLSGAFRVISSKIFKMEELGLPEVCRDLITVPQGLILFTGPAGSGKSTSIACLIEEINLHQKKHIVTLEEPIEYIFSKGQSLVHQREIGQDAENWEKALRALLRQDPNIILVGEMRDFDTISSTVTLAETGHLVFSTLHTNSTAQTIDRLIDVFPSGQQNQIRSQLASVIVAVISQRLVRVKGGGRKAIFEVLIANDAVKNAIREAKTHQIDNIIQTSNDIGMMPLEKSILKLISTGELSAEDAFNYTSRPDQLRSLLNNNNFTN